MTLQKRGLQISRQPILTQMELIYVHLDRHWVSVKMCGPVYQGVSQGLNFQVAPVSIDKVDC